MVRRHRRSWVWLLAIPLSGNNLGQVIFTHVPLPPSSIIWYWVSTTPGNPLEFEIAPGNTTNLLEFLVDDPGKFCNYSSVIFAHQTIFVHAAFCSTNCISIACFVLALTCVCLLRLLFIN